MGLGGLLLAIGGICGGCEGQKSIKDTHTVTESFSDIRIKASAGEVRILPSLDGTCRVDVAGIEKNFFSVAVVDGVLTVTEEDTRKWYEYIGIYTAEVEACVYLPDFAYTSLTADVNSGDVEVGQVCVESVKIDGSSGEIEISGWSGTSLEASTSSGEIELTNVQGDRVAVDSNGGDIDVENTTAGSFVAGSGSGKISLENVLTEGETRIESNSGSVRLTACDGASYTIKTSSGSVKGSVRTAKIFIPKSNSGRIDVPKSTTGGVFDVQTSSGNISIKILG